MTGPVSLLKAVRLTRLLSPCCAESVNSILHGASSLGGLQQKRTIINKTLLHLPDDYPDPWPYQERGYFWWHMIFDYTKPHFTQNSKLIVVEGNIGSEKSRTAKELADQLGFLYMPEFRMDHILIDRYGNDMRDFYPLFPARFRIPDIKMFCKDPFSDMSAVMRDRIFNCRFDQYLNAIAHILNTGQGVVLERTPHTDFVFANAMRAKNYIGPEYFKFYYYLRKGAIPQLNFWPHLVVYLDAPVDKCLETIRGEGDVDKIATFDAEYLKTVEDSYKDALREFQKHSKILIYDWSQPGNTDTIVEDIERIDFDFFEWHSGEVFEEWFEPKDEVTWCGWRQFVTDKSRPRSLAFDSIRTHEVGELYINPNDMTHFINTMKTQVLKSPYSYGYIREKGDSFSNLTAWRTGYVLPEPWFDYFYKEAYYDFYRSNDAGMDPYATAYNPDYVHGH